MSSEVRVLVSHEAFVDMSNGDRPLLRPDELDRAFTDKVVLLAYASP